MKKKTRKIRWTDLALLPFAICVLFLIALGKLCGLTYKQISVVFNLWIQGAVLVLSALAPSAAAVWQIAHGGSLLWVAALIPLLAYAALAVYGFVKMLKHYHLPFDHAFDLCVMDLQVLAHRWHSTYQMVNIIIFVVFYLLLIGLNLALANYILQF